MIDNNSNKRRVRYGFLFVTLFIFILLVPMSTIAAPIFEGEEGDQGTEQTNEQRPQTEITTVQALPSFRDVAKDVLPVVVEVNVVEVIEQNMPRNLSPWDFFFGPQDDGGSQREFKRPGLGSGVIVRQEGNKVFVLTNNHVVGSADEISVRLYDEREFEATLIGKDPRTDLALIQFKTRENVPIARLGNADSLAVGDWVLAVGNPYGFESTVTAGIVSALGRSAGAGMSIAGYTDYIQTDASINPGNSGGALVNLTGEVVGINTWIASQTGGSVGIGFAIPVNIAKKVINDFIEYGKVQYGWLGVGIADPAADQYPGIRESLKLGDQSGSLVVNVYRDSPAYQDGMLPGDFIIEVDGTAIKDSQHLTQIVGGRPQGEKVDFTIIRYGERKTVTVTLDERPAEEEIQSNTNLWPGMVVVEATEEIRNQLQLDSGVNGVVVGGVTPQSRPAVAGFKPGDVITEINEEEIDSVMGFYKGINQAEKGEVMFKVVRQGSILLLGLMK